MTSGQPLTAADKERVWRLVARGMRTLSALQHQTGICERTLREVILDACAVAIAYRDECRRLERVEDGRGE